MKELKLIARNFAPHFFAISLLLLFIASRCGFASFCACSYVIAPECSHILIFLISSVCFIISSFISLFPYTLNFKGRTFNFQGKIRFFISFLRFFCKKSSIFAITSFASFSGFSSDKNGIRNAFENSLLSERGHVYGKS